uniref:Ribosomal protein S8 n=1 Tax=Prototheca wickerhamii TaxID=3111 RepID=A0A067Z184_PROWI|nr:ribosomal protein S8 [Prototheca wickerhamii]
MITDTISDMLTRIRNANLVCKPAVLVYNTKINVKICEILQQEGFIINFFIVETNKKELIINLKYKKTPTLSNGNSNKPCITNLKRISKPGLRIYSNYKEIPKILGGLGIIIISTSKGLMTDKEARKYRVGGELICSIW